MKKVIKAKHGTVTIDMPESFNPDEQDERSAIKFLDSIGHETNAGVSRIDCKDEDGNVIGSIVWTSDQEAENRPTIDDGQCGR